MDIDKVQLIIMKLTHRSDVLLALFLSMLVMMMILPIPTVLIDIIIGFNMTIAISILMLAIYIVRPLQFSSFPSVLLLVTLFRLALSISTTRAILLEADAGEIITTFGNFVVGGNLVVGFVIFLIITIVQFIVITKGAERVAEVSARFSLDAMPGKQMSIDSDLRAGIISMEQARDRRETLAQESQLFGAMDGAMKFVKGDAIAGILIILINLLGGISIGVFQNGLSTSDAAEIYSILTIGDGLVSQIPALFVAISAGIIVTRVTGGGSEHLGADISKQFLEKPYAILVTAVLIFFMGFIPGFPSAVFMVIGIVLGGIGWSVHKISETGTWAEDGKPLENKREESLQIGNGNIGQKEDIKISAPIMIELSSNTQSMISPEKMNLAFGQIRQDIFNSIGVPIPKISFHISQDLEHDTYGVRIHELPVATGKLSMNKSLIISGIKKLSDQKIPMEEYSLYGKKGVWVDNKNLNALKNLKIESLDATQVISWHLKPLLMQHASKFIGIQEVYSLFNKIESDYSELIKEAQKALPLPKIADVLRKLVHEGVPIRDLRQILEVLAERGESEPNTVVLVEFVREALKEHICNYFSNNTNTLFAYLIELDLEQVIENSIRQSSVGIYLQLDPNVATSLKEQIQEQESKLGSLDKTRPVIVTSSKVRAFLSAHLEKEFGYIPILSHQEISSLVSINTVAKIRLVKTVALDKS